MNELETCAKGRMCRGLRLLREKVAVREEDETRRGKKVSIAKLARDLDMSWNGAKAIYDGTRRPSVDDAAVMRERYGVPVESWRQW
jgi:hypothetical protein